MPFSTEEYTELSYIFLMQPPVPGAAHHRIRESSWNPWKNKEEFENEQEKMESEVECDLALEVAGSCMNKRDAS